MPISREPERACKACGAKFPTAISECPYCPDESNDEPETPIDFSKLPSQLDDPIERIRRFHELHLCGECGHFSVCEIGRASRRHFEDGFLILISDCTEFAIEGDEDDEIKTG